MEATVSRPLRAIPMNLTPGRSFTGSTGALPPFHRMDRSATGSKGPGREGAANGQEEGEALAGSGRGVWWLFQMRKGYVG